MQRDNTEKMSTVKINGGVKRLINSGSISDGENKTRLDEFLVTEWDDCRYTSHSTWHSLFLAHGEESHQMARSSQHMCKHHSSRVPANMFFYTETKPQKGESES